jgi:hypothetical protein
LNKKVILLILFSITLFSNSCNLLLPGKEVPLGTSTMIAKIQGVIDTFSNVNAYKIAGISGGGTSNGYNIELSLGTGEVGEHKWGSKSVTGENQADSSASLNYLPALLDVGGFTVTNHDEAHRLVEGSFNFSVIDPSTKDTITVRDGQFSFYYVNTE